jgi:hypothetical protein
MLRRTIHIFSRSMASKPKPPHLTRPAPHPLPPDQQREFQVLQRQADQASSNANAHPDAPQIPPKPDFDGDTNPTTGELGGPKREPVQRWVETEGDWSFKGRVSDF